MQVSLPALNGHDLTPYSTLCLRCGCTRLISLSSGYNLKTPVHTFWLLRCVHNPLAVSVMFRKFRFICKHIRAFSQITDHYAYLVTTTVQIRTTIRTTLIHAITGLNNKQVIMIDCSCFNSSCVLLAQNKLFFFLFVFLK